MILLGLETATTVCAAAVVEDGVVRAEASVDERNVHAEKLLLQVDQVLGKAAIRPADLSGVAVSIGPGSFTGLRIGLSVAKGLAYACGLPLVGVPTLQALAHHLWAAGGIGPTASILALLDARRDEVYAQLFDVREGNVVPVWDVRVMTVEELIPAADRAEITVTGDAPEKLIALLSLRSQRDRERFHFAGKEVSRCSAASVALLGMDLLRQGTGGDPPDLEPRYIKEFFLKSR